MTKEQLQQKFKENMGDIGPVIQRALKSTSLGLLTGEANCDDIFPPDPTNPVIDALKSGIEDGLELGINLAHNQTIGRLIDVAALTKNPEAINDVVDAFHELWLASSDVKTTMDALKSDKQDANVIEDAVRKETKAFANQMIKKVLKAEFNKKDFLKKSELLFDKFEVKLHRKTNFDTTTVIEPLVDDLRALTKTFAESARDKDAVAAYRKAFGETVAKHDKIFDAKSSSSANELYKLVFNVLRAILALVTPLLPDNVQPYVNAAGTFFTPKKPNSDILIDAANQLDQDLADQAVVDSEEEESASATMH